MGRYKVGDVLVSKAFLENNLELPVVYTITELVNGNPIATITQDVFLTNNNSYEMRGFEGQQIDFKDFDPTLDKLFNVYDNISLMPAKCTCDIIQLVNTGCKCGGV